MIEKCSFLDNEERSKTYCYVRREDLYHCQDLDLVSLLVHDTRKKKSQVLVFDLKPQLMVEKREVCMIELAEHNRKLTVSSMFKQYATYELYIRVKEGNSPSNTSVNTILCKMNK
jgi:hypothetical protein